MVEMHNNKNTNIFDLIGFQRRKYSSGGGNGKWVFPAGVEAANSPFGMPNPL
jgi:hypothetical protein